MNTTFKKALLAGTAIVAVGAVTPKLIAPAQAADSFNEALLAAGGTATVTGSGGVDDVWDIDTEDGTTTSDITLGMAGGTELLLVKSVGGVDSTADIDTISFTDSTSAATITVGDGVATHPVVLTVTGDISGNGTADLSLILDAEDGAGTAGADATIDANGDIDLGGGTITLDDDDTGNAVKVATLLLSGTGDQDITGVIGGAVAGDGVVSVTNTGGTVTFNSGVGSATAVGAVKVGGGAATTATAVFVGKVITASTTGESGDILLGVTDDGEVDVTFFNTVTAGGSDITIGTGAGTADSNSVTFDATTQSFVVTGAIAGGASQDVNTLNIEGGATKTITFATAMGANIDDINIAASTTLNNTGGGAITASTIDLGTSAELNITAAATVTGDINGNGTLDIDADTTWVGDIGDVNDLTALEIFTGKVLKIDAATAAEAITVDAATITLEGVAAGITTAQGAQNVTFAEDIDTAVDGAGVIVIGNTTGSANFSGYVGSGTTKSLASLTVTDDAGVSAVNASDDLFIDAIVLNTSDTLNLLGSDNTVSGTIAGGAAGRGAIVVGDGAAASEYTFSSAIGGTTVGSFTVKALSTANISKSVATKSGGTGINIDGTLNVDTDGGAVAISDANGIVDFDGTVSWTGAANATVTGSTNVFLDGDSTYTTALDATKTLTITGTAGDVGIGNTSDTTLVLGNQLIVAAGDDLLVGGNATTTVQINIAKSDDYDPNGAVLIDGTGVTSAFDLDSDTTLHFGLLNGSLGLNDGDSVTIYNGSVNTLLDGVAKTWVQMLASGDVVLDDSALVDLQDNGSGAQDLIVKAVFEDANDVVGDSQAGAAQALMDFEGATDELSEARGNLLTAETASDANEVAESLGPDVGGGAVQAAQVFAGAVGSITEARLAMLRNGTSAQTGMSAGEMGAGSSWWVQAFGTHGSQDDRDGVDGYDVDNLGVAVGGDTQNLAENATVGVALSYANTSVDSDDANSTETDIDSFQLALYGDYDIDSRTYVAGQIGYIWGSNDTTRENVGAISGNTASGDFDSSQVQVRAEVGRDFMYDQTKLTPKAVADYTWYSSDSYTETGAGTANLDVDQDDVSVFNIGAGVDASWNVKHSDGSFCEPALHALVRYDLANDDIQSTDSFTGGGGAFNTNGADPARLSGDLGADLTYHTTQNWDLKAGYNFEVKEDYTSHSGLLKAAYKF